MSQATETANELREIFQNLPEGDQDLVLSLARNLHSALEETRQWMKAGLDPIEETREAYRSKGIEEPEVDPLFEVSKEKTRQRVAYLQGEGANNG